MDDSNAPVDLKTIFSNNFIKWMKIKGMKQTELARGLHTGYSTVHNWYKGVTVPSLSKITEIAKLLDIEPEQLTLAESTQKTVKEQKQMKLVSILNLQSEDLEEIGKRQVDISIYANDCFYFFMMDDSMEPIFYKDDLMLCMKCSNVRANDYVMIKDTRGHFVYQVETVQSNEIILIPRNNRYNERIIEKKRLGIDVFIVGRILEFTRKLPYVDTCR